MLEFKTPIGKVKVVHRRSRLLTKVVVLVAVLLAEDVGSFCMGLNAENLLDILCE